MKMEVQMKISVDFKEFTKNIIKPMHGVNNSPVMLDKPIETFREAGIPYVRMHDTGGAYGRNTFVDIPNVFPDFDADENDPASYTFEFTDAYFKQIYASDSKVFYRLGVTIENWYKIKAYRIYPPKDFAKWARICEHIIRHYTEGWANGFHYDMEYWEIWNEPENPPMWQGTKEQFFEMYKVTASHLKKCFPNIKVGGYASCGFYVVSGANNSDFFKSFITWAEEFTAMCAKENIPLDFFSWHRYFDNSACLIPEAEYVRELLDKNGLTETESIFNEWNYCCGKNGCTWDVMKEAEGASNIAKAMITLQKLPVDKAMYYDALPTRAYCGLYYFPSQTVTPTYYTFKAFNSLYKLKKEVAATAEDKDIAVLAAADGKAGAVMIANAKNKSVNVTFDLKNVQGSISATITDKRRTFKKIEFTSDFKLPAYSVLLLEMNADKAEDKTSGDVTTHKFAGLGGN